jgi:serine/threonine protein kinase
VSASLVGQKLDKYEITELLGHGGMATVYKAYQRDVDRSVAIKVLPPHPGQDKQFVERFRLEARTIARLQHPHILPLYDYGDDNDVLYLVMAYVDGGSLNDRIRRGRLPLDEVQSLVQQVASALDYAHRQNVIHRDIKPDNILLDREGHTLLSDFGIVKLIEDSGGGASLTATGGLVGTPAYMSPEQAQGLTVSKRSDIYSLGIVVFEMLTGQQPYQAETPMQVVLKHITAPVPVLHDLLPDVSPDLEAVLQRTLVKNPDERYESAQEFYADFVRALQGDQPLTSTRINLNPAMNPNAATTIMPAGTVQLQPTMIAQSPWNPLILLGGFAIIALLVVAVVVIVLNFNRSNSAAPTLEQPTSAVILAPVNTAPTFGKVTFSTDTAPGDTANVQVSGLTHPASGSTYVVWLENTLTQAVTKIGSLKIDALGNGQFVYTDTAGRMLPTVYNAVLISEESSADAAQPSGKIAYSGLLPPELMDALDEILVASPDGIPPSGSNATANSSLIEGALEEANIAMQHAGLAAKATSAGSMHAHAEHTLNILHGTFKDYNGDGGGQNPGHGFGVPYFLDRIEQKLNAAANAPGADRVMQNQIELIRVCIVNTRSWVDQISTLEAELLPAADLDSVENQLADSTVLADKLVNGTDLNQNGQVEPFEGECGLQQIDTFGISVGNLTLFAGALPQGS